MKYVIAICLLLSAPYMRAQIVWQKIDTTSLNVVGEYQYFLIDSNFYIIGGVDIGDNPVSSVWQYKIKSNIWMRNQEFDSISGGGGVSLSRNGYVLSGVLSSPPNYPTTSICWRYDPRLDAWAAISPIPEPRFYGCSYTSMGHLFTCLGRDSLDAPLNTNWVYDTASNQWQQLSPKPGGGRIEASVAVVDSFAYIAGGRRFDSAGNGYSTNELWRYNVIQDRWDSLPPIPGLPRAGAILYSFSHFLLLGFGLYQNSIMGIYDSNLVDLYRFDIATSTWSSIVYNGEVVPSGFGAYFQYGNKCYVRGGLYGSNFTWNSNMYEFDATPLIEAYSDVQEVARDIQGLRVYPVPVRDILHIDGDIQGMDISVTDMMGRHCAAPVSGRDIAVSSLPAGVYVLHVSDRGTSVVRKFLID